MIRTFVGIGVPDQIASTLEAAQAGLDFGRIVPAENFHLTLAFIGEQPDRAIEDLHYELDRITADTLELTLQGLGVFGGEAPRVLFAEIQPNAALKDLRDKVRIAAREANLELEHRRFHPHITLARFGKGLHPEQAGALQTLISKRMRLVRGTFPVTEFALYESVLGQEAPVYDVIASYELNAPASAVGTIPGR